MALKIAKSSAVKVEADSGRSPRASNKRKSIASQPSSQTLIRPCTAALLRRDTRRDPRNTNLIPPRTQRSVGQRRSDKYLPEESSWMAFWAEPMEQQTRELRATLVAYQDFSAWRTRYRPNQGWYHARVKRSMKLALREKATVGFANPGGKM